MFHEGDLQSGISRAIAERKLVACFVRDDSEGSRLWEEEWLGQTSRTASPTTQSRLASDISERAVLLRIQVGSQESGFLNAFCTISAVPTLAVIHNGQVLDKIEYGVSKEDFHDRLGKALGIELLATEDSKPQDEVERVENDDGTTSAGIATSDSSASAAPDASDTTAVSQPSGTSHSADMSSLFPDRAQRLEAEKARREAAEKAERVARANARRKEAEEAQAIQTGKGKGKSTDVKEKEKARRDWLVQQKQRKDDAKKEKERILAQIEQDKIERRARSQKVPEAPSMPLSPSHDAASRRAMGAGGLCSLMVRLFDGSSIKGRFEPSTTLSSGVRDWIRDTAGENAADVPFIFKQILAPQPSRSIEISEEHQSLQELGLAPSASLVLVPVQGYTEAYAGGGRGYMSTALNAAYNVAGTASNLVSSVLSYVPGFGTTAPSESAEPTGGNSSMESSFSSIRVKTLADQRSEVEKQDKQTEFYNGNSSAFEGRKDDNNTED